eukprot:6211081-Pleurochrysis_carterae.AAC.2
MLVSLRAAATVCVCGRTMSEPDVARPRHCFEAFARVALAAAAARRSVELESVGESEWEE